MKPGEFVAEVVVPTVREFAENRRSRRHAYLACIVTFHVKDHLRKVGQESVEDAVRASAGAFFDVVRGVCNGAKHVNTTGGRQAAFTVGDDTDRSDVGYGMGGYGEGVYGGIGGREIIADGRRVDLYDACAYVLKTYLVLYPHHFVGCDISSL